MKIKKKIGIISMALGCILAVASCGNTTPTDVSSTTQGTSVPSQTTSTKPSTPSSSTTQGVQLLSTRFSSISVDYSNVKTLYYFGEEFSSEGLVVKNNFVKNYSNGKRESYSEETELYSIDTSEVDFNTVGVYPVTISSRVGSVINMRSYNVVVKANPFDDVKNLSYFGGLNIEYITGDSFNKTYKVQDKFNFSSSLVKASIHVVKIDAEGNKTENDATTNPQALTIDTSNVPVDSNGYLTTRGTFIIKYSFTQKLTIDGIEVENKIESFTYVTVDNPVTNIEKISVDDTTFEATITSLDLSKWKFRVTREIGEPEEIYYSKDLFTVTGLNQYIPMEQEAQITLNESPEQIVKVKVTITPSSLYNIFLQLDLNKGMEKVDVNGDPVLDTEGNPTYNTPFTNTTRTQVDSDGYCYGTNIVREIKPRNCDGIGFSVRVKVELSSKSGAFEVVMPKAGKILIFVASTGDDARPVNVSLNDESITEIVAKTKDVPTRYEIDVKEAGTISFTGEKQFYVYGAIIVTER